MSEAGHDSRHAAVREFLASLQERLCTTFGPGLGGSFQRHGWTRPRDDAHLQGEGITAVQEEGGVLERAGVAFSDVRGTQLPPAATARNPQLAGRSYRAMGVSVVMHPRNPHVPTSHMNVRYFAAGDVWWFGGGFDLTPFLPYEEDIVAWHRAAHAACAPFHPQLHEQARRTCDEYFFIRHRAEARGIGGIFYDDLNDATPHIAMPWERCFGFMRATGEAYLAAYERLVQRRCGAPYGERERAFQLYRRGRYVEFNLVQDRGTLFGLQSGGRADSILVSLPPAVGWRYRPPDAELDARLLPYLTTRRGEDWLAGEAALTADRAS